jgi:hypothetical protein
MTVFKSQLEQLMPAEELLFDPTPGFGKYKPYMEQAIAHPANLYIFHTDRNMLMKYSEETKSAVIAWAIACEGHIGFWKALRKGRLLCIRPRIRVTNTDIDLLKTFGNLCGVGSLSLHRPHLDEKNRKPLYNWEIVGLSSVKNVLDRTVPHFPISRKREVALKVLEFCNRRLDAFNKRGYYFRNPYNEEELNLVSQVKMLNGGVRREIGTELK